MVLSVHVETLVDAKKSIAENKARASRNTTFSVDDLPTDATLAAVTAAILEVIAEEGLTAEKVPFSHGADVFFYGYTTRAKSSYKELTPLRNDDEFHKNMKAAAARTEPEEFLDLSCVTNLTDVVTPPVKWKGGAWLSRDDLIVACNEREIPLPQNSSGDCLCSVKDLKEILQPYHRGETIHQKVKFDMFVVMQAKRNKEEEDTDATDTKKTKKKKKAAVLIELLHPAVYRNPKTAEYVLDQAAHANEVVGTFELEVFEKGMEDIDGNELEELIGSLRTKALAIYHSKYQSRDFVKEGLFFLSRLNSKIVTHLDNDDTLRSKISSLPASNYRIKVSTGAAHTEPVPNGMDDYAVDRNGHYIPPTLLDPRAALAAQVQHETEEKANDGVKALYFNDHSPLRHGFDLSHATFIKTLLTSHEGKSILEELAQRPPVFSVTSLDGYLPAQFHKWDKLIILKVTCSIPARDKFPPIAGREDEIPMKAFQDANAGGSGASTVGSGLHALANAVAAAKAVQPLADSAAPPENHASSYASIEDFLDQARVPQPQKSVLSEVGIDDLDSLHELVSEAHKQTTGTTSFAQALLAQINMGGATAFNVGSCLKILAQSKKPPTLPAL
jgi:hypothetical protein